ncbi:hypothetical protein HKX48_001837 [Thoreauomyces humboldtii]|nr:hypothetical protein HKX48_001837 [Thoreauomyces humboldtii]
MKFPFNSSKKKAKGPADIGPAVPRFSIDTSPNPPPKAGEQDKERSPATIAPRASDQHPPYIQAGYIAYPGVEQSVKSGFAPSLPSTDALAGALRTAGSRSSLARGVNDIPDAYKSSTETAINAAYSGYTTVANDIASLSQDIANVQATATKVAEGIDQISGNKLDLVNKVTSGVKEVIARTPVLDHLVSIVDKLADVGKSAPFVAPLFCVLKLIIDNEKRVRETDAKCNDLVERVSFMAGHIVDLAKLALSDSVQGVAAKIESTLKNSLVLIKAYRQQGAIVRRLNMGNAAKFAARAKEIEVCAADMMICLQIQQTTQLTILQRAIPVDDQDRAAQTFLAGTHGELVAANPAMLGQFAQAIGEQVSQQNLAAVGQSLGELLEGAQAETEKQLTAAVDAVRAGLRDAMVAKEQLERERFAAPKVKCVQCDSLFQEWEQENVKTDAEGACRYHPEEWDGWERSQPCCGEKDRPCAVAKHSAKHHCRFPYAALAGYSQRILGYSDTMDEYVTLDERSPEWYTAEHGEYTMRLITIGKLLRAQTRGALLSSQAPSERYRLVIRIGTGQTRYFRVMSPNDFLEELSFDAKRDPETFLRTKVLYRDEEKGYLLMLRERSGTDEQGEGFEIEVLATVPWQDGRLRKRLFFDRKTLELHGSVEDVEVLSESERGRTERKAAEQLEAEKLAREAAEAEARRIEKENIRKEKERLAELAASAAASALHAKIAAAEIQTGMANNQPSGLTSNGLEERLLGLERGIANLTSVLERFLPAIEAIASGPSK